MFERNIKPEDIEQTIQYGNVIEDYPKDTPYPSQLVLHYLEEKPIHIVIANDEETSTIFILTAYHPDEKIWDETFRKRRQ